MSIFILSILLAEVSTLVEPHGIDLLAQVMRARQAVPQSESMSGVFEEIRQGSRLTEGSFEADRDGLFELTVIRKKVARNREQIKAFILRPDSSFQLRGDADSRLPSVTVLPGGLAGRTKEVERKLGVYDKLAHCRFFDHYFFDEFILPLLRQSKGIHLISASQQSNGDLNGAIYFDDSAESLSDQTIDFRLNKDGRLIEWSYPQRFQDDPKSYKWVVSYQRAANGTLTSIEEKLIDRDKVGFQRSFRVRRFESTSIPHERFSLSRFGLIERKTSFIPTNWIVFAAASLCFLITAVFWRMRNR
jgi:hypothetical protein